MKAVEVEGEPPTGRAQPSEAPDAEPAGGPDAEDEDRFRVGMSLDEMERMAIARTLASVDGNRRRAAEILGIGERTLYRKLKEYELS